MARKNDDPTISDAEAAERLRRGGRRFTFSGCFSFLLLLTTLAIALLAWFDIPPPQAAQEKVRVWRKQVTQEIEQREIVKHLNKDEIVQIYDQARGYLQDPDKREQALEKLDQAKQSIKEQLDKSKPAVQGYYNTLLEKTDAAMTSIRDGAQTARSEVEELVEQAKAMKGGGKEAPVQDTAPETAPEEK